MPHCPHASALPQPTPDLATPSLRPFAIEDAPALIEAVFQAQKVSFEAQRELKSGDVIQESDG
jgi:hypothetical protein